MNIGVLLKQVPDTGCRIMLSPDCTSIAETGMTWVVNPYDEYAVEEAVRFKEAHGGEVIVFTLGPAHAEESMRQAFAVGADRGVRIDGAPADVDALLTARLLANEIAREGCGIVFAGRKSVDQEEGRVHIGVAEVLGWPHVSPVERFEVDDTGRRATVTRCAGGSTKETVAIEFPAVIGCEKGLNQPRYPTLPGKLKAKSKPISVIPAETIAEYHAGTRIDSYAMAPQHRRARILAGSADEVADELVRLLHEEVRII